MSYKKNLTEAQIDHLRVVADRYTAGAPKLDVDSRVDRLPISTGTCLGNGLNAKTMKALENRNLIERYEQTYTGTIKGDRKNWTSGAYRITSGGLHILEKEERKILERTTFICVSCGDRFPIGLIPVTGPALCEDCEGSPETPAVEKPALSPTTRRDAMENIQRNLSILKGSFVAELEIIRKRAGKDPYTQVHMSLESGIEQAEEMQALATSIVDYSDLTTIIGKESEARHD